LKTANIIAGMQILLPYYPNQDGCNVRAEHEELRLYATDRPLSPEDLQRMIDLGWHQEHDGRDYGKEFAPSDYRPGESWVSYV
jgi:hypothetical protein